MKIFEINSSPYLPPTQDIGLIRTVDFKDFHNNSFYSLIKSQQSFKFDTINSTFFSCFLRAICFASFVLGSQTNLNSLLNENLKCLLKNKSTLIGGSSGSI